MLESKVETFEVNTASIFPKCWRKKEKKKKETKGGEKERERARRLSGWFAVRGPKVSENLDEFQEPGSPRATGVGRILFVHLHEEIS